MHPLIMKELANSHIRDLHDEARVARLAQPSKPQRRKGTDAATEHRVYWFRRLAAGFAVALVMVLALASAALAVPVPAASQGHGHGRGHVNSVPTCVPKQMPGLGLCRHAGTGEVVSVGPSATTQGRPVTSTSLADSTGDLALWAAVGLVALTAGAGVVVSRRGRVATA